VRKGIARLLRSAGFVAAMFGSAEECLENRELSAFYCLIVDIHLAGVNGLALMEELNRGGCNVPVVFMTAHDEPLLYPILRTARAPVCLRKPVGAETLLAAIQQAVRLSSG
jgi:FixJ family two-component response regulator